ncbi:MAG: hypothetical protein LC624_03405 [Halobacteriales archaeon]|nr:hypothetical protein [Halobacteriales archaeon]
MKRALLLGLLLLVPGALAHGQSIEVAKDVGRYHVIFYTFDLLTAGEGVRLAWNVTDRATQQLVEVPNGTLVTEDHDAGGKLVNRTTLPPCAPGATDVTACLAQRHVGFLFTDTRMGPEGRTSYALSLPPDAGASTAAFDNHVYPASTPPGGVPLQNQTPLPGSLALLAAVAALAFLGRRR